MNLDFTDLVLLIGTNPLPNYVSAKYFMKNNNKLKKIWMICSENFDNQESTKDYAESLQKLLKDDKLQFPELIFIEDVGSKSSIESGLEKIIKQVSNNKVHLSFTGGTKAMSAYSYSYLKSKVKSFSASYLSSRDFKIKCDCDDEFVSDNLNNSIKISFDDLLKLHLFKKKEEETDKYEDFIGVTNKFQELINQNKISQFYLDDGYQESIFKIRNKDVEKIFKNIKISNSDMIMAYTDEKYFKKRLGCLENKEKNNFKDRINILKKILKYKPNDIFISIIKAFPEEYRLYKNSRFNKDIGEHNYKRAVEFMDGFWFEQYVEKLIENNLKDKFDEILINQKPYREEESKNFELDIVLMKGYQLIGISCTTSPKKSLCKSKGFEIILRTRQIGGEEAKAVLLTRAGNETVKQLQSELLLSTGTAKSNILVLGDCDWKEKELLKKMKKFIFD
jgi:hypothetical protein